MKFGYIRISSIDQKANYSLENQKTYLLLKGVSAENIFEDVFSGATFNRPGFNAMFERLREGDKIYVYAIDRFARNVTQALLKIEELEKKKVALVITPPLRGGVAGQYEFDPKNPHSLAMLRMFLVFAQMETDIRRSRQLEGIKLAKLDGKYKGRPSSIKPEVVKKIKIYLNNPEISKKDIAATAKVSRSTLYKIIKKIKEQEGKKDIIRKE